MADAFSLKNSTAEYCITWQNDGVRRTGARGGGYLFTGRDERARQDALSAIVTGSPSGTGRLDAGGTQQLAGANAPASCCGRLF